jgi:hypothetical protein
MAAQSGNRIALFSSSQDKVTVFDTSDPKGPKEVYTADLKFLHEINRKERAASIFSSSDGLKSEFIWFFGAEHELFAVNHKGTLISMSKDGAKLVGNILPEGCDYVFQAGIADGIVYTTSMLKKEGSRGGALACCSLSDVSKKGILAEVKGFVDGVELVTEGENAFLWDQQKLSKFKKGEDGIPHEVGTFVAPKKMKKELFGPKPLTVSRNWVVITAGKKETEMTVLARDTFKDCWSMSLTPQNPEAVAKCEEVHLFGDCMAVKMKVEPKPTKTEQYKIDLMVSALVGDPVPIIKHVRDGGQVVVGVRADVLEQDKKEEMSRQTPRIKPHDEVDIYHIPSKQMSDTPFVFEEHAHPHVYGGASGITILQKEQPEPYTSATHKVTRVTLD